VVLATRDSERAPSYSGIDKAMAIPSVEVRIFGKPTTRNHRRMGVVLAHGATATAARKTAMKAAAKISVR
jgi:phosphoribosylglycinamide formyltransferase 2